MPRASVRMHLTGSLASVMSAARNAMNGRAKGENHGSVQSDVPRRFTRFRRRFRRRQRSIAPSIEWIRLERQPGWTCPNQGILLRSSLKIHSKTFLPTSSSMASAETTTTNPTTTHLKDGTCHGRTESPAEWPPLQAGAHPHGAEGPGPRAPCSSPGALPVSVGRELPGATLGSCSHRGSGFAATKSVALFAQLDAGGLPIGFKFSDEAALACPGSAGLLVRSSTSEIHQE
mmetsp:Transcript_179349/g.569060  ORF Transcript_179349/g.569060 Transcript_179349/m.569060 type:complete len:231 (+) Transcript_179349:346-1038(+)